MDEQEDRRIEHLEDKVGKIEIELALEKLKGKFNNMPSVQDALTALTTQVTNTVGVEASAVALINGIPALIAAAGVDPNALAALQTQLAASAATLSAAVTAQAPPPTTPAGPASVATAPVAVSGTGTTSDVQA